MGGQCAEFQAVKTNGIHNWIIEMMESVGAKSHDTVTVTRTVTITGYRKWVESTLERSVVPREGDIKTLGDGMTIRCTSTSVKKFSAGAGGEGG